MMLFVHRSNAITSKCTSDEDFNVECFARMKHFYLRRHKPNGYLLTKGKTSLMRSPKGIVDNANIYKLDALKSKGQLCYPNQAKERGEKR